MKVPPSVYLFILPRVTAAHSSLMRDVPCRSSMAQWSKDFLTSTLYNLFRLRRSRHYIIRLRCLYNRLPLRKTRKTIPKPPNYYQNWGSYDYLKRGLYFDLFSNFCLKMFRLFPINEVHIIRKSTVSSARMLFPQECPGVPTLYNSDISVYIRLQGGCAVRVVLWSHAYDLLGRIF